MRLLTLTGPGVGKTRRALQLAADVGAECQEGAAFVDLSHLRDPGLVVLSIAQTLGIREVPGRPVLSMLEDWLRARQLLLPDNLEQVLAAGPELARLVAAFRDLTVLATNCAPLRVRAKREYPVEALARPDPVAWPPLRSLPATRPSPSSSSAPRRSSPTSP